MERCTPDNIKYIYRKIAIQLTSVGLAHAHPKYVQNLGCHAWGALEGLLGEFSIANAET